MIISRTPFRISFFGGAPDFTEAEINAVSRVMRSGWVGMGQGDSTGEESAFRSVDLEGRSV